MNGRAESGAGLDLRKKEESSPRSPARGRKVFRFNFAAEKLLTERLCLKVGLIHLN